MSAIASQITSLTIVYSIVYSGADQSKHQSSASLAFVWGIRRGPVNSPHKWPVTRKMFPFDDVIMSLSSATYLFFIGCTYLCSTAYECLHSKKVCTVTYCYNEGRYDVILCKSLDWLKQNINQSFGTQKTLNIEGLVQDCCNYSVLAMELLQSCTKPPMYQLQGWYLRCILWVLRRKNKGQMHPTLYYYKISMGCKHWKFSGQW